MPGYWSLASSELYARLGASSNGLSAAEAETRRARYGPNQLSEGRRLSQLALVSRQLRSPLLLLLLFAAVVSGATGEWMDASLVLVIVVASAGIGARREYQGQEAAAVLAKRIRARARVLRGGAPELVPVEHVVPGDVVLLAAGSLVPADAVLLEAADCHVSEAVLTGRVSWRGGARSPTHSSTC